MVAKIKSTYLISIALFLLLNISFISACVCGDGIKEKTEECDKGSLNGFFCWASYGTSCEYCTSDCKIKKITNYCGDGIVNNECEECDDGNSVDDDFCSNECTINNPEPKCDHEIAVRYSYSNSFGLGIAFAYNNGTWIKENNASLGEGEYTIKYFIDNKKEAEDNVHIIFKLDESIILDEFKLTDIYSSKELKIDFSGKCGEHTLSLETESDGNECDLSDNSASRKVFIKCEPPQPELYCGDGEINQASEECDDGNNADGDGCSALCKKEKEECECGGCEDFSKTCGDGIKQANEQCDDGNRNNFDGCSKICMIEVDKNEDKTECENNDCDEKESSRVRFEFCEPIWECSGWGECINGIKTRECTDLSGCKIEYNKPYETTECQDKVISSVKVKESNSSYPIIFGLITFLILFSVLIYLSRVILMR